MDPVENATYMVNSGNISADDEKGTPLDNDQEWNYKKFMTECANRTVGYGEDQDENQGDGSNCLSAKNEEKNKHFRVFTLDKRVADYMDGDDEVEKLAKGGSTGAVSSEGWAYPTTKEGVITDGYKTTRADHLGVDIAQPGNALGNPIYAAHDGEVVASGPAEGFGSWIIIFNKEKNVSTVYGHMRSEDLMVKVGDTVKAGQQISRIGNEGFSSGPHLHFEIWTGNRLECKVDCSVDPAPILEKAKNDSSSNTMDPRRNV
ncbi:M23 family metallopeptidase [Candidatus Saccharibacteria bacterium]|nr:M23 family metallopeptidase [Candidatus Saccharibacteria bacterium]